MLESEKSEVNWQSYKASHFTRLQDGIWDWWTSATLLTADSEARRRAAERRNMVSLAKDHEFPSIPNTTPLEELQIFLRYAAEVEHGLMVQYLYAAYAAKNEEVKRLVRTVAIEEMGHFLTVENLLIASGAPLHLARYDWSENNAFDPFEFFLGPVNKVNFARFAAAEMPSEPEVDEEDTELLADLLQEVNDQGLPEVSRVGRLYMKIYWLLRPDDKPLADPTKEPWPHFPVETFAVLFPDRHVQTFPVEQNLSLQALPSHWKSGFTSIIAENVDGREAALKAVADVSAQGEGFGSFETGEEGHFDRFLKAYQIVSSSNGDASFPVPHNPSHKNTAPDGADANLIKSKDGTRFARLGDLVYEFILLTLAAYYKAAAASDISYLSQVSGGSLDSMTAALKVIGTEIVKIEREDPGDTSAATSALCFSRPNQEFPDDLPGLKTRLDEVSRAARDLASELGGDAQDILRQIAARQVESAIKSIRNQIAAVA